MKSALKVGVLAGALLSLSALSALGDPVEGMWKRSAENGGTLIEIAECDGSFCTIVRSGEYIDQSSGKFDKKAGGYAGKITDLATDKTYSGTLAMQGADKLEMKGCVLKIFCKSEVWTKQ